MKEEHGRDDLRSNGWFPLTNRKIEKTVFIAEYYQYTAGTDLVCYLRYFGKAAHCKFRVPIKYIEEIDI